MSLRLRLASVGFVCVGVAVVVACGQVTGLSDDYTFDSEAGSDAGTKDAAADATVDAGPCSTSKTLVADAGSDLCRGCIATKCCAEVLACETATDCTARFDCNFVCTKRGAPNTDPFKSCVDNCTGGKNIPTYQTLGTCVANDCATQCGFQ